MKNFTEVLVEECMKAKKLEYLNALIDMLFINLVMILFGYKYTQLKCIKKSGISF